MKKLHEILRENSDCVVRLQAVEGVNAVSVRVSTDSWSVHQFCDDFILDSAKFCVLTHTVEAAVAEVRHAESVVIPKPEVPQ